MAQEEVTADVKPVAGGMMPRQAGQAYGVISR